MYRKTTTGWMLPALWCLQYVLGCGTGTINEKCDNSCSPVGLSQCADGKIRSCLPAAAGCFEWSSWATCDTGTCADAFNCRDIDGDGRDGGPTDDGGDESCYDTENHDDASDAGGATYYASPGGGGTGASPSSPFKVASFWPKAKAGDTLILLDGTYADSNSMIDPPDDLGGTGAAPITVKALNDGKVLIDGQGSRVPIFLSLNDWFVIEGVNACNSSASVVILAEATHNIVRRVCAWGAAVRGTAGGYWVFDVDERNHGSKYNLLEDCAGWGWARVVFLQDESEHNVLRRCFALYQGEPADGVGSGYPIAGTYYGTGNIVENCIATVDMLPSSKDDSATSFGTQGCGLVGHGPPDEAPNWSTKNTYEMYGNIYYRKAGQRGYLRNSGLESLDYRPDIPVGQEIGHGKLVVKDFILFNQTDNSGHFLESIRSHHLKYVPETPTQTDAPKFIKELLYSNISVFGNPPAVNFSTTYADSANHSIQNILTLGGAVGFKSAAGDFVGDYIWAYDNTTNFVGGTPANVRTDAIDVATLGGDILQYRLSENERPKVNGRSVGAQIKYRYVNGTLTSEPLWPWPMNQRIKDALVLSGNTPIDVTKTVFELGGGTMPAFGP